jgi:hypothetical protein
MEDRAENNPCLYYFRQETESKYEYGYEKYLFHAGLILMEFPRPKYFR